MVRARRVLAALVVMVAVAAGATPASAQPAASLGGILVNYLELRAQAQQSHKKVLAAEAAHADLAAAAAGAADAERVATARSRDQFSRFGQEFTAAVHHLVTDRLLGESNTDPAHVAAGADLVDGTARSFEAAVTEHETARRKSVAAAKALEAAVTDLRQRRAESENKLKQLRTALDWLTPDQRDMLNAEAANRSDLAGAGGSQAASGRSKVSAPTLGVVTSNFGPRWGTMHYGLDIANRIGTPIRSVMDGVVAEAGPASGFGLWVKVAHTDGTAAIYGHIDSHRVRAGQQVRAGQVIAAMGNRGESTGPHLHFEISDRSGTKMDPLLWLRGKGVMAW